MRGGVAEALRGGVGLDDDVSTVISSSPCILSKAQFVALNLETHRWTDVTTETHRQTDVSIETHRCSSMTVTVQWWTDEAVKL